MNPGTLWLVGWRGHQWPPARQFPCGRPGTSGTIRMVIEASSQNSSKYNSATCSHYDYHHHSRFNWAFLGHAVNQSWPTRWAVCPRQVTDRWAITAIQWHYYTACPYQQGTGCLLKNHTPMVMMTGDTTVPVTSSISGAAPSGQVAACPHQSTALGEANPSTSSLHINRQAAPLSNAGFSQPSQDLQDQAFSLWDQAHSSTLNHSDRPFLPLDFLPWFPASLDPLALGQHAGMNQQQHQQDQAFSLWDQVHSSTLNHSDRPFLPLDFLPWFPASLDPLALGQHAGMNQQQHQQVTIAMGLPGATQYSTTDNTSHGRMGLATLLAIGPWPYNIQTAASGPNMTTDITMMAKMIPNVPPKLQQGVIQGEFIDLSELLQAGFQFKYASIDSNNMFKLIHKDEMVFMWPRKKASRLTAWVLDSLHGPWMSRSWCMLTCRGIPS